MGTAETGVEWAPNSHEKANCPGEDCEFKSGFDSAAAVAPRSVYWQRLFGTDVRDRLVAGAGARDWRIGDFIGCAARNVYGRDVSRKPPFPAMDFGAPASLAGLWTAGTGHCGARPLDFVRYALCRLSVCLRWSFRFLGHRGSGLDRCSLFD